MASSTQSAQRPVSCCRGARGPGTSPPDTSPTFRPRRANAEGGVSVSACFILFLLDSIGFLLQDEERWHTKEELVCASIFPSSGQAYCLHCMAKSTEA